MQTPFRIHGIQGILIAGFLAGNAAHADLLIKKNGVTQYQLNDAGTLLMAAPGFYSEEAVGTTPNGELRYVNQFATMMYSLPSGTGSNLRASGRVVQKAFISNGGGGLLFRNEANGRSAQVTTSGDFLLKGGFFNPPSPLNNGSFAFTQVVYGSSGAQRNTQYSSPTSGYITPRRNISAFFNSINTVDWPFNASSVPLNGLLRVPTGTGPFPLVLFAHGNHDPLAYSEPGYMYLCNLLASQGIIAGSIDANFLNGGVSEENDARAILHLEHVKQFGVWNAQAGHPLFGKVDMSRVMIVGHSRGGEAVGHAAYFSKLTSVQPDPGGATVPLNGSNGLGPYSTFQIKAAFAIAPTDQQYVPVSGPTKVPLSYFVIHGGQDADVSEFDGYSTFDRSLNVNLLSPTLDAAGFKAMAYVTGACHNFFNSTWAGESSTPQVITRAEQEQVAKTYVSSLAQGVLLGKSQYLELFKDYRTGNSWLPQSTSYISQYQDRSRLFINHYEDDNGFVSSSPPTQGSIVCAFMGCGETDGPFGLPFWTGRGLRLDWTSKGGFYTTAFPSGTLSAGKFQYLVLRVGQTTEPNNPVNFTQDFSLTAKDVFGVTSTVLLGSFNNAFYPQTNANGWRPNFMQTFRIPLARFSGLNYNDIKELTLTTDITAKGTVYVDDIQFSY